MTDIAQADSRSATKRAVTHIGTKDTHALLKALTVVAIPLGIVAFLANTARGGGSMDAVVMILLFGFIALIVGVPMLLLFFRRLGQGLAIAGSNAIGPRMLPSYTHIFHSKHGVRVYADAEKHYFAIGRRAYRFEDVSSIDYATPNVRIRLIRGENAIETIEVGGVKECEQYMRGLSLLVGIPY